MSNAGTPAFVLNRTPNTTLPNTVPAGKFWYINPRAKGTGMWNIDGAYVPGGVFIEAGHVVNLICGSTEMDCAFMTYVEFDSITYEDVPVIARRK